MSEARLARWLREVELAPGAERQDAIDAAANSLVEELDVRAALDLVLLAHGDARSPSAELVATAVHRHDETAALRPEDLETQLAAAVAVVRGLEGEDTDTTSRLGLAVLNAEFAGLSPGIPELPGLAVRAMTQASERLRARRALKLSQPNTAEALGGAQYAEDDGNPANHQDLNSILRATEDALEGTLSAMSSLVTALNRRMDGAEEELELLAWSFGDFSEIVKRPFKKVPEAAAPVVLAVEVAQAIKQSVPLPSAGALLSRALGATRSDKVTTIAKATNAAVKLADAEWLLRAEGHRLLPVLSAFSAHAEFRGKATWVESMARWQIDPNREICGLALAEETLREIVLTRAMG